MTEVIWHYFEMGSPKEAERIRPAYRGITSKERIGEEYYRLAQKGLGTTNEHGLEIQPRLVIGQPTIENVDSLIRQVITQEYMDEHLSDKNFADLDEAIYFMSCGWHYQAENIVHDGKLYADQMDDDFRWYVMITRDREVYRGPQEGGIMGVDSEFIKWTSFATKEEAFRFVRAYNAEAQGKRKNGDYTLLGDDETVSSIYPEGYIPTGWVASSSYSAQMVILPYMVEQEPWRYE
ncbi:MAG: hypothetical protein CMC15_13910 [Flavobacteriaceae bacterium]|nr:hypothetical protein [Flavobacteriaceae bacterium]